MVRQKIEDAETPSIFHLNFLISPTSLSELGGGPEKVGLSGRGVARKTTTTLPYHLDFLIPLIPLGIQGGSPDKVSVVGKGVAGLTREVLIN